MPGMERQTINKDPLQGKKIIWIMGMITNGYKNINYQQYEGGKEFGSLIRFFVS